jgi:hypothetical protein
LAVPAGTSGHGCGCIDMMTRFCGREQEQGKAPAAPRTMALITAGVSGPWSFSDAETVLTGVSRW